MNFSPRHRRSLYRLAAVSFLLAALLCFAGWVIHGHDLYRLVAAVLFVISALGTNRAAKASPQVK
jgi:uncharacterized membrane protein